MARSRNTTRKHPDLLGGDDPRGLTSPGPAAVLRAARLRVTKVRVRILQILSSASAPLNAQEIADRLADMDADRVTVYRTLGTMVKAGLAHRMDPGDRIYRFARSATSPNTPGSEPSTTVHSARAHEHPHFVCDECGTVECLSNTEVVVQPRPGKPTDLPLRRVHQRDVLLHGTCDHCEPTGPSAREVPIVPANDAPLPTRPAPKAGRGRSRGHR